MLEHPFRQFLLAKGRQYSERTHFTLDSEKAGITRPGVGRSWAAFFERLTSPAVAHGLDAQALFWVAAVTRVSKRAGESGAGFPKPQLAGAKQEVSDVGPLSDELFGLRWIAKNAARFIARSPVILETDSRHNFKSQHREKPSLTFGYEHWFRVASSQKRGANRE